MVDTRALPGTRYHTAVAARLQGEDTGQDIGHAALLTIDEAASRASFPGRSIVW